MMARSGSLDHWVVRIGLPLFVVESHGWNPLESLGNSTAREDLLGDLANKFDFWSAWRKCNTAESVESARVFESLGDCPFVLEYVYTVNSPRWSNPNCTLLLALSLSPWVCWRFQLCRVTEHFSPFGAGAPQWESQRLRTASTWG